MFLLTGLIIFGSYGTATVHTMYPAGSVMNGLAGFIITTQIVYTLTTLLECVGQAYDLIKFKENAWLYNICHTLLQFIMTMAVTAGVYGLVQANNIPAYVPLHACQ